MPKIVIFLGLGLVALVGLLWLFSPNEDAARDRQLDASVMGVEALRTWLPENDIAVVRSHPRLAPLASDLSMAILPLYDTDLLSEEDPPQTKEDYARQQDQRDIYSYDFFAKLEALPTLVVLPKWRTGFATAEVAHASLLIDTADITRIARQAGLARVSILRRPAAFETASLSPATGQPAQQLALFHAQLFDRDTLPSYCAELVGFAYGSLVIRCRAHGSIAAAHYLSDPDLLNNHGLSVAGNADFVPAMIKGMRPAGNAKAVYLDTSPYLLLDMGDDDIEAQDYSRDPVDLARFFAYPLSVLWALAGVVLGIAIWRGARRFGPPLRMTEDRPEVTKTAAIDAKARLLRLSGNDGRMAAEFVQARLSDLATQTFGQGIGDAGTARYFALLERRNPALASDFRRVTASLIDNASTLPPPELYRQLETFRDLLERVTHGPDPVSKPH
jgi:hypothetical protein